jgi:hypothetical protein
MVVFAPRGPPMNRRVYLSHLDMPKGDFRYWHIASFACDAEYGRLSGHSGLARLPARQVCEFTA